jgi:hypothetical protein
MTETVVYQAIFQTEKHCISVQYEPLENGLIFITQVDITERAVTAFEQRQVQRHKRRRGIVLDEQEEYDEAMQPTTRRETLQGKCNEKPS